MCWCCGWGQKGEIRRAYQRADASPSGSPPLGRIWEYQLKPNLNLIKRFVFKVGEQSERNISQRFIFKGTCRSRGNITHTTSETNRTLKTRRPKRLRNAFPLRRGRVNTMDDAPTYTTKVHKVRRRSQKFLWVLSLIFKVLSSSA